MRLGRLALLVLLLLLQLLLPVEAVVFTLFVRKTRDRRRKRRGILITGLPSEKPFLADNQHRRRDSKIPLRRCRGAGDDGVRQLRRFCGRKGCAGADR